jgi:hypothetical protein
MQMPDFQYRVIPFIGTIKAGEKSGATIVAKQLEDLINKVSDHEWEFYRVDRVQIAVRPGCLGRLFGASTSYIGFDQVIFRKEKT